MDLVQLQRDPNTALMPHFTARIDQQDLDRLAEIHRARVAPKTWLARQSDLRQWLVWCQAHGVNSKAPTAADICLWLSHMATDNALNRLKYNSQTDESELYRGSALAVRSIRRRYTSAKWFFDQIVPHNNPARDPIVAQQLAGIARLLPSKPKRAAGLQAQWLTPLLQDFTEQSFVELRDKLVIALGFAGAMRVSDLASIQIEHIQLYPQGAVIGFEQRKRRNEYSQLQIVAGRTPETCPLRLLERYLAQVGAHFGPLLRRANRNGSPLAKPMHPTSIARIIQKRCGHLSAEIRGHSLRRGFIDSALSRGAPISEVMKVSGHKDPKTLMLYLDECGLFSNHPGAGLY
ncbi:tyrosine-type recombinase/integrase [Ferrimonas senticii]|uniref:tyrosine-type recombinase/integrase n=1 Tax=Ferrimonas senticii TaxID=394566 RepID=UPI0004886F56|nr:tyrosine-type recombinase/integrase [Ferrimonas senticii]